MRYQIEIPAYNLSFQATVTPTPLDEGEGEPAQPVQQEPLRGIRGQTFSCTDNTEINSKLSCLKAANANTYYWPPVYPKRAAYYHSALMPHRDFDSLAYLVSEAHARDMEVYALLAAAQLGWPEHPEWNARLNHSGVPEDWLDFTLPEARSFIADVAEEIVTNYDVDGILLDYIRWDGAWTNFNAKGNAGAVTEAVRGVYRRVKAVKALPVAASPFRCRSYSAAAGQMWYDWLDEGIVDYVTPMTYEKQEYQYSWEYPLARCLEEWQASVHFPKRIIPRLSVCWMTTPEVLKDITQMLREIQACYDAGASGMTLWDDRYICDNPRLVEALANGGW